MPDRIASLIADGALGWADGLWNAIIIFLVAVVACTVGGVTLIVVAVRRSKQPPIPPAHIVNLDSADAAYARASRVASRAPRMLARGLAVTLGVALILGPWVFIAWLSGA